MVFRSISSIATVQVPLILQASKPNAQIQNLTRASVKSLDLRLGECLDQSKRMKSSFEQDVLNIHIANPSDVFLIQ
jgi:hypothetical protein